MQTDTLKDLLANATDGPWTAERDLPHNRMPRVHGGDRSLICECGNWGATQEQWEANAAFIALAPQLAAEVIRLREALQSAHDFIASEYSCPTAQALEGEYLSKDARPVFSKICAALTSKAEAV